jgi:hypothetical protein
MPQTEIATAADYADALLTARRAKNWLFLILLFILLAQIAIFLSMRHWPGIAAASLHPGEASKSYQWAARMRYIIAVTDFLGVALVIVLAMVLLLITKIMLVGRLIGVSRVTSAYIMTLVLGVLVFPWQSLLGNASFVPLPAVVSAATLPAGPGATVRSTAAVAPADTSFKIPGVLYTWGEVTHPIDGANFQTANTSAAALHWARYIGFPLVAIILLLLVQSRGTRGLRQALGESAMIGTDPMAAP